MKKIVLVSVLFLSFSLIAVSCKDSSKEKTEEVKQEKGEHDELYSTYQCPMDCEKGKTYDQEGKCPVCKMDLKLMDKSLD